MPDTKIRIIPLVVIQSDEHDKIVLSQFIDHDGSSSLSIAVHDADSLKSFLFDSAHELEAFAKRLLYQADIHKEL